MVKTELVQDIMTIRIVRDWCENCFNKSPGTLLDTAHSPGQTSTTAENTVRLYLSLWTFNELSNIYQI